jgi:hypothetical protein
MNERTLNPNLLPMASCMTAAAEVREHLAAGRRWCYFVPIITEDGGVYRSSVVFEGVPGHFPLDYTWGPAPWLPSELTLS